MKTSEELYAEAYKTQDISRARFLIELAQLQEKREGRKAKASAQAEQGEQAKAEPLAEYLNYLAGISTSKSVHPNNLSRCWPKKPRRSPKRQTTRIWQ